MSKRIKYRLILIVNSFLMTLSIFAQPGPPGKTTVFTGSEQDTLTGIRTFLEVCNVYKKLPLQLDLVFRRSGNWVNSAEDTMRYEARFRLQKEGSYISFGEVEQLANDSLLLLVNNKLKRMILYANHQTVANRFQQYMGYQSTDSSSRQMAAKYTASSLSPAGKDTAAIEVKSRIFLAHTSLPKETILVSYNTLTYQLHSVLQTNRSLVAVSKDDYEGLVRQPEWQGKCLAMPDGSFFIIKEQVSAFLYSTISYKPDIGLPVRISDLIVAEEPGKYLPVKAYSDFVLTQNF
jgi:hypothetical protein